MAIETRRPDYMHCEFQSLVCGKVTVISQPLINHTSCATVVNSVLATARVIADFDHGCVHSAFGCNQFYPSR